jgi:hypothetical protein
MIAQSHIKVIIPPWTMEITKSNTHVADTLDNSQHLTAQPWMPKLHTELQLQIPEDMNCVIITQAVQVN